MDSDLNEIKSFIDRFYLSYMITVDAEPEPYVYFSEEDIDDLKVVRFYLRHPRLPEGFVAAIHDYIRSLNVPELFHLILFHDSSEILYNNRVYLYPNVPLNDVWFRRQLFRAWFAWQNPDKKEPFKAARLSMLNLYAHLSHEPLSYYRDMVLMCTCDDYRFSNFFWMHHQLY